MSLASKLGGQEVAQFGARSFPGVPIVFQPHAKKPGAIGEARIIEAVIGAGIGDELHIGRFARALPRELCAIRQWRHIVQFADENECRDLWTGSGLVGAGWVEGGSRLEFETLRYRESGVEAGRGDRESGIGALRVTDGADACRIDTGEPREVTQGPEGVREAPAEVYSAGLLEAPRGEVIDEKHDITPARESAGHRSSVLREAEAGMQHDERRKRAASVRLAEVTLNLVPALEEVGAASVARRLGLTDQASGVEFHQLLGH